MALDYEALVRLERRLSLAVHDLEAAEQQIEDECCANHGLGQVQSGIALVQAVRHTLASAMLDVLRDETRSA